MERAKYNACVANGLRGKELTKDERKLEFCVVAKVCSGKANNREEALTICSQPKPPKPEKTRKKKAETPESCEKDVFKLSKCMVPHIDMDLAGNVNSIEAAIVNAMMECKCPEK